MDQARCYLADDDPNLENYSTRKELLCKKRSVDNLIKKANSVKDYLAYFPTLCHYERNGIFCSMKTARGNELSPSAKQFILRLLEVNMKGPYGSEWREERMLKRQEMAVPEARYILIHETSDAKPLGDFDDHLVGFVHYRFVLEERIPVLYLYELQLATQVQGKGLGLFIMQLTELIARKSGMSAIVLTVQKANVVAMRFYTCDKLRYKVSSISPSRTELSTGTEWSYEILCKTFDSKAKAAFEE